MPNIIGKIVALCLLLILLSGCGVVVRYLDSSWADEQTVYDKNQQLPSLEIPPELSKTTQHSLSPSQEGN